MNVLEEIQMVNGVAIIGEKGVGDIGYFRNLRFRCEILGIIH